jgi:hypothetical protein
LKIISLGAGVQSSTLFLMSCYGDLEKADAAIFADTQDEPKSVYAYLDWLEEEGRKHGIPIYRVTAGSLSQDTVDVIEGRRSRAGMIPAFVDTDNGGMTMRQCTGDYKISPLRRKARELMKEAGDTEIEMWIGISTDEIQRMKSSGVKYITHRWPLIELRMDRNDCKRWFNSMGGKEPPRSACVYCPFHKNSEWARLKREEPDEFAKAVEFDRKIRNHPKLRGKVYLHRSMMPLDEIDFENTDQLDFGFVAECEGMCGI